MPSRTRPPASGAPRTRAGKKTAKPPRAARAAGVRGAPKPEAAPAAKPLPKVQRTCYEVRLMVCPRVPASCPETWPVGERVLCGSLEMLARFEKASGEDIDHTEAGLADALGGLTIRSRLDADPDEQTEDGDDGDGGDR